MSAFILKETANTEERGHYSSISRNICTCTNKYIKLSMYFISIEKLHTYIDVNRAFSFKLMRK